MRKQSLLAVTSSPHIKAPVTTQKIMLDMLIALFPAFAAGFWFFGPRVLWAAGISVACCVFFEWGFEKLFRRENTIYDLSAAVTGLLLAMNISSQAPLWLYPIGAFFAIAVVKQLFGGIGQNFANPALTARIALFVSFSSALSRYAVPGQWRGGAIDGLSSATDAVSSATPLTAANPPPLIDLLLGLHGGAMGETCALALILGGIYLLLRRVINPVIPLSFIGTAALLGWAFGIDPLFTVLTGGLLIGAIFMATDYSTSPSTIAGQFIFGFGCGAVTMLIRRFGSYPDGVSFAILIMNIFTPLIDRYTRQTAFGGEKVKSKARLVKPVLVLVAICVLTASALVVTHRLVSDLSETDDDGILAAMAGDYGEVLPGSGDYELLYRSGEYGGEKTGVPVEAVKAQNGWLITVHSHGQYSASPMLVLAGFDSQGNITGVKVLNTSETPNLGTKVGEAGYTDKFKGLGAADIPGVDGVSGATKSSAGLKNALLTAAAEFDRIRGAAGMEEHYRAVLPGSKDYELLYRSDEYGGEKTGVPVEAVKAQNGWLITVHSHGQHNEKPMLVLAGFDSQGIITGVRVLSNSETPRVWESLENADYAGKFTGLSSEEISGVDGISGATNSSNGLKNALLTAAAEFARLSGEGE